MKAEFFQDRRREWRVRIRARNGRIVWATSESYGRRRGAVRALDLLMTAIATGNLKVRGVKGEGRGKKR